jgi:hypothetical protein
MAIKAIGKNDRNQSAAPQTEYAKTDKKPRLNAVRKP